MSSAVRDLAEAEFIGRRDSQNHPLPSLPSANESNYAVNEWTLRNVLSAGSLLGKSCQGTLKLAGHDVEMQHQGFKFGKHLALAWQVNIQVFLFICYKYFKIVDNIINDINNFFFQNPLVL